MNMCFVHYINIQFNIFISLNTMKSFDTHILYSMENMVILTFKTHQVQILRALARKYLICFISAFISQQIVPTLYFPSTHSCMNTPAQPIRKGQLGNFRLGFLQNNPLALFTDLGIDAGITQIQSKTITTVLLLS